MLPNASAFPTLSLPTTTDEELVLPDAVQGSYAVILVYRGSWCPYCVGQLHSFANRHDAMVAKNITTVALSADSRSTARKTVEDLHLPFAVGCEAPVLHVAQALECYTDPDMRFFQSTGFVLDPEGKILLSVYSSGAIGRLNPTDVMAFADRHVSGNFARPS